MVGVSFHLRNVQYIRRIAISTNDARGGLEVDVIHVVVSVLRLTRRRRRHLLAVLCPSVDEECGARREPEDYKDEEGRSYRTHSLESR